MLSEMYTHLSAAISGSTCGEWMTMLHRREEVRLSAAILGAIYIRTSACLYLGDTGIVGA